MSATTRDAQALTYLAMRLRSETPGAGPWDEHGTYAVISKLVGQNLALVVEQVTRNAADPEARTPGAVNRPFTPALKPQPRVHPPRRGDECRNHAGQYADNCGGCRADQLAATYEDEEPNMSNRKLPPGDPAVGAALVRAELERVLAAERAAADAAPGVAS